MSDMVTGMIIFDYTELPAYEGLASGNPSSPKYPISMTITENAVRFKMHYCFYRCSIQNDISAPIYGFSIDDIHRQVKNKKRYIHKDDHNIVHIEEIILELPFAGIRTHDLTEIIKKTYIANFPQIREGGNFTGSQFLNKIIEKELSFDKHRIDTDAFSYSTLWLMDLYDTDGKLNLKGDNGLVDKFLRKLLLDFMFDLKHSSVFQTCADYDRMYSGLMSDYYFSALMHKCEYYYYRDLTTQAIKDYEKKKQDNIVGKDDEEKIIHLYAKELFDAEEQWANDIRNPLSDELFAQKYPDDFSKSGKSRWGRYLTACLSILIEHMTRRHWKSWFASPEEEMRRIYFPLKTYCGNYDTCNSVALTEQFYLVYNKLEIVENMISLSEKCRGKSSRWFLNRYDFNDILHLHLFRGANPLLMLFFILIISILCCASLSGIFSHILNLSIVKARGLLLFLYSIMILSIFQIAVLQDKKEKQLDCYYYSRYVIKKFWAIGAIISVMVILVLCFINYLVDTKNCDNAISLFIKPIQTMGFVCISCLFSIPVLSKLACYFRWSKFHFLNVSFHPIGSWHLFFPKLTASIITAWITLTVAWNKGLDQKVGSIELSVVLILLVLTLCFFLYLVDHACPSCGKLRKLIRSIELFMISYSVSLGIGCIFLKIFKLNHSIVDLKNAALFAVFIGLYLRMIFRSEKQMTDI